MKRALTALPLLALLLGLALFLWRRGGTPFGPTSHSGTSLPSETNPAGASGPSKAPDAPPKDPAQEQEPGAIRFVITLRGQPAAGVPITVMQSGVDKHMKFKAEADGTQLLRGLPPGEFAIGIEPEDAMTYRSEVIVGAGQTVLVTVDLKPGGKIFGRVTDRAGLAIPDTRVFLLDGDTGTRAEINAVLTDKDGRYALKGVPPGNYAARFRNVLFQPLDRQGLAFRNSGDEYRIDVVLEAGARISGRVVDEQNEPIEGAEVIASTGDSAGISKSAADGSFTVTGLFETPANISAAKRGYGKVVFRNLSGNPTDILFRLPKAGVVLGQLDIDTVPRQTQVTLSRYDDELRQVIPSDSQILALEKDKAFALIDVPPGTYWMDVRVEGYEQIDRPQILVERGKPNGPTRIIMRKKN